MFSGGEIDSVVGRCVGKSAGAVVSRVTGRAAARNVVYQRASRRRREFASRSHQFCLKEVLRRLQAIARARSSYVFIVLEGNADPTTTWDGKKDADTISRQITR